MCKKKFRIGAVVYECRIDDGLHNHHEFVVDMTDRQIMEFESAQWQNDYAARCWEQVRNQMMGFLGDVAMLDERVLKVLKGE